jgi:hypothetical protein
MSQITVSDQALLEVVKFWWKEWTGWQTADTEQEMNFLIPDWIKEIVQELEAENRVGAKFDYATGLWKN